ncbi:MAG: chlorite dismutase family protein [Elusimicrobia bacterium]|nr:chlorite dismutase family protein [Elusimicrobiota bacterium]
MQAKTQPEVKSSQEESSQRAFIRFATYKVDPGFRKLDSNLRLAAKEEVFSALDFFKDRMAIHAYSLLATRAEADFLFWQAANDLEIFEEFASKLARSAMGPYLRGVHSFLSTARQSVPAGVAKTQPDRGQGRGLTGEGRFLFVMPLVKTKAWHQLSTAERQKMTEEHAGIVGRHPSVRLEITSAFGLDDQEFVAAFETDSPQDFLNLIEELRESKAALYTNVRDTPTITAVARDPKWILDALG